MFSDTNYSSLIPNYPPLENAAKLPNNVWILPPTGSPRVLIDELPSCPNGVAFSADEKILYVSVGPLSGDDPFAATLVDVIYAYDLVEVMGGKFANGKRVFAKSDYGFVDGFAVDSQGNIFATTSDGVSVFNAARTLLGKILLPGTLSIVNHPTAGVVLAGDKLVMMRQTDVLMLELNTSGISRGVRCMSAIAPLCRHIPAQAQGWSRTKSGSAVSGPACAQAHN